MRNLEKSVGLHRITKGKSKTTPDQIDQGVFDLPVHANQNVPGRRIRCTACQGPDWECVRITQLTRRGFSKPTMSKPTVAEIQRVRDLFFTKEEMVVQFYPYQERDQWCGKHIAVLWNFKTGIVPIPSNPFEP